MTLALYGHPLSSYTWKVQIALHAAGIEHEFRILDGEHPEHMAVVQAAGPAGKFPVLADGEILLFEATSIIEYIALNLAPEAGLLPLEPDVAIGVRMLDRVFDNYVMGPMQQIVSEHLRAAADSDNGPVGESVSRPDAARVAEAREQLIRSYAWLEGWVAYYPCPNEVTLIECAAAPALFYADWVQPIPEDFAKLREWRAHLLQLPAVARCVEAARPYRSYFPLGAPDRD